jgi:hypothetical protein
MAKLGELRELDSALKSRPMRSKVVKTSTT